MHRLPVSTAFLLAITIVFLVGPVVTLPTMVPINSPCVPFPFHVCDVHRASPHADKSDSLPRAFTTLAVRDAKASAQQDGQDFRNPGLGGRLGGGE